MSSFSFWASTDRIWLHFHSSLEESLDRPDNKLWQANKGRKRNSSAAFPVKPGWKTLTVSFHNIHWKYKCSQIRVVSTQLAYVTSVWPTHAVSFTLDNINGQSELKSNFSQFPIVALQRKHKSAAHFLWHPNWFCTCCDTFFLRDWATHSVKAPEIM